MTPLTLWQIRTSIFCEKARWALDLKAVPHERRDLMPGLHSIVLRLRGRGATVPVLDVDGRSVRGSSAINAALEERFPEPPLYPHDPAERAEALALEARFDPVGHEVRRLLVDPILADPPLMTATLMASRPAWERRITRALHPASAAFTRRRYGIDAARVTRARARVEQALDEVARRVRPSGYLVGDAFSVADLTAAALLAPLVQPPEYPDAAWRAGSFPDELRRLRDAAASHAGGAWVLETYRRHR